LLYLKQELHTKVCQRKEKNWQKKGGSDLEPLYKYTTIQHGSHCHGLFGSETISILGSIEVPRRQAISKIFSLQSNGQESKEDPNFSAFRSVRA